MCIWLVVRFTAFAPISINLLNKPPPRHIHELYSFHNVKLYFFLTFLSSILKRSFGAFIHVLQFTSHARRVICNISLFLIFNKKIYENLIHLYEEHKSFFFHFFSKVIDLTVNQIFKKAKLYSYCQHQYMQNWKILD